MVLDTSKYLVLCVFVYIEQPHKTILLTKHKLK
jgi:hypothetical protein